MAAAAAAATAWTPARIVKVVAIGSVAGVALWKLVAGAAGEIVYGPRFSYDGRWTERVWKKKAEK